MQLFYLLILSNNQFNPYFWRFAADLRLGFGDVAGVKMPHFTSFPEKAPPFPGRCPDHLHTSPAWRFARSPATAFHAGFRSELFQNSKGGSSSSPVCGQAATPGTRFHPDPNPKKSGWRPRCDCECHSPHRAASSGALKSTATPSRRRSSLNPLSFRHPAAPSQHEADLDSRTVDALDEDALHVGGLGRSGTPDDRGVVAEALDGGG